MAVLRNYSEAAERNKAPIGDVLENYVSKGSIILELASGTLQHASYLASRFPEVKLIPSDIDANVLARFEQLAEKPENLSKPMIIDARSDGWPDFKVHLILCINMIHIAPWDACLGLMERGANSLKEDGLLITYGPYFGTVDPEVPSNIAFDQSLRERNPHWGVRGIDAVIQAARQSCLQHELTVSMPANNHMLVFRQQKKQVN